MVKTLLKKRSSNIVVRGTNDCVYIDMLGIEGDIRD